MSHDAIPPTRIRATCPGCGEVELTPPDAEPPDPVGSGGRPHQPQEVALPLWLAILLGVFWLAVLVCVAFTVWRMVANLKALTASVQALSERLTPALEELSTASQEAADHAARLSERGASAAEQR
jgi:hypothetical protein